MTEEVSSTFAGDNLAAQRQLEVAQEEFALLGVYIGSRPFRGNNEEKHWLLNWDGDWAKLVWEKGNYWQIEALDIEPRNQDDKLRGKWCNFSLYELFKKRMLTQQE